jgi:2-phosphosulfolactate phosphatase
MSSCTSAGDSDRNSSAAIVNSPRRVARMGPQRVIDVAFTPAALQPTPTAVVVDVLRATSTAQQALAAGYRQVLCADSVEHALQLRGPGRVLAGERHCLAPAGFDQGNSPREAAQRRGEELVLATTNGAPATVAAAHVAQRVLLASLLNLDATLDALRAQPTDVLIVCSGTDGTPALEDVYLAGRLSLALPGPRTNAARIAEALTRTYPTALAALQASADAGRPRRADLGGDVDACARESVLDVGPLVLEAGDHVALVADALVAV